MNYNVIIACLHSLWETKYYHIELAMLSHIKLSRAVVCQELQNKSVLHEAGANCALLLCLKSTASHKYCSQTENVANHNILLLMEHGQKVSI